MSLTFSLADWHFTSQGWYTVPHLVFRVIGGKCASLRWSHATVVKTMGCKSHIVAKGTLRRVDNLRRSNISFACTEDEDPPGREDLRLQAI